MAIIFMFSPRYRIGPFEVESALIQHPAVMESAVVSSPDPVRGEVKRKKKIKKMWKEIYFILSMKFSIYTRLPWNEKVANLKLK